MASISDPKSINNFAEETKPLTIAICNGEFLNYLKQD